MITYDKIKSFNPCYDPVKFIPETYSGSPLDILRMGNVPAKDRLWVVVRADFLTDKQIHAYGLALGALEVVKLCPYDFNQDGVKHVIEQLRRSIGEEHDE